MLLTDDKMPMGILAQVLSTKRIAEAASSVGHGLGLHYSLLRLLPSPVPLNPERFFSTRKVRTLLT